MIEITTNTAVDADFSTRPTIANTIERNVDTTAARWGEFPKGTATAIA